MALRGHRLGYRLGYLVCLIYGKGTRVPLFGTFPPYSAHVPSFHISYYSLTITLVSAPTSCFTFAVPMRDVYCVGYTPLARDPRSLYGPY